MAVFRLTPVGGHRTSGGFVQISSLPEVVFDDLVERCIRHSLFHSGKWLFGNVWFM